VLEVLDDSDSSVKELALSLIVEMLKNQVPTPVDHVYPANSAYFSFCIYRHKALLRLQFNKIKHFPILLFRKAQWRILLRL